MFRRKALPIILLFVLTFYNIIVQSISVHEQIPYSRGTKFSSVWAVLFSIATLGTFLNGFSLFVLLTDENVYRIPLYKFSLYLNFVDLLFSVYQVLFAAINMYYNKFYGGQLECLIISIIAVTLFVWSISILALIAYAMDKMLAEGKPLENLHLILLMILCPIYSLCIALLSIYLPMGGYFLQASGIYLTSHFYYYFFFECM